MRDEIHIAGIDFNISRPDGFSLLGPEPCYGDFLRPGPGWPNGRDGDSFHVTVSADPVPDTGSLDRVFQAGRTWSLFRGGKDYFIAIGTASEGGRPLCLARMAPGFSSATVYYDQSLVGSAHGGPALPSPFRYPLDKILAMYALSGRSGMLLHGACVEFHGRGYVFPGLSGAGKTTLSRLFAQRDDAVVLTDERTAVRKTGGGFTAYGTPWHGEMGAAVNRAVELDAVFFIRHSSSGTGGENAIREIGVKDALERLIPVSTIPWYDERVFPSLLASAEGLAGGVPTYELSFAPTPGVVAALEEFVHAEKP